MFEILSPSIVSLIQSILLILSGIVILIASIGVLNLDKDMANVVYARVHILGMVDVAGIIVFVALGQYLFAVIYLVLAPFLAHAMANAYFYGEDDFNSLNAADMVDDSELLDDDSELLDDASDIADDALDEESEPLDDAADDASESLDDASTEENVDETENENLDSGDESND